MIHCALSSHTGQNYITFRFFEQLDFEKINKKFKTNGVFCQTSLHFMYEVHLPGVYYKILSALWQRLCSKNCKVM